MIVRRSIGVFLLVVGLVFATIQLWVAAFICRPTPLGRSDPGSWQLRGVATMRVKYGDGTTITGWRSRPDQKDGPVVLLVHGRSGNISSRAPIMQHLMANGIGVLMFDYRGYGASKGQQSESNLNEDTLTAYGWLRSQGVTPPQIVVVGQSLGNGPATMLAANRSVGALLLVSPFTCLPDALAERLPWLPVRLVPWTRNRFDVEANLIRFDGPVLLVASNNDGLVPVGNARRLRAARPHLRWFDVSPLRHDRMLQAIAEDGRLANSIQILVPAGTSTLPASDP